MSIIRKIPIWLRWIAAVPVAVWILYQGYNAWAGTTDTVKVAVVAAIVSVFTFAVSKYYEQKEIYRIRIVKEKTDTYLKLINIIFDILMPEAIKKNKKVSVNQLASNLYEIKKELMIWGSDSVIECWIKLFRMLESSAHIPSSDGKKLAAMLHAIGGIILAIRKDIGYSGTNLNEYDIAGLILKADDAENQKLLEELKKL